MAYGRSALAPTVVDHQRISLIVADRIAVPGRRHFGGVLLVHAHPPHFVILAEQHDDPVRQLQH